MATHSAAALTPSQSDVEIVPASADYGSKLQSVFGILRKFVHVPDLANAKFSLPAQFMHPVPNLEYWTYLDRPETFVSIGSSPDPLGRMLEALRFWFTKDLKYVKGKPVKPYNSTLGEFFRCNWDVEPLPPIDPTGPVPANISPGTTSQGSKPPVKVSFLTEQTSHHPPVSAFYIDCPERGIVARGYDQISAHFHFMSGSIRVNPGDHNMGIFITLTERDEQYRMTHPQAKLSGFLSGSLTISVVDSCYITCAKTGIKTILEYPGEGWMNRQKHLVNGVIFRYDPNNDNKTRIKDVPRGDILARIEGCWMDKVYFTLPSDPKTKHLLVDVEPLHPVPKNAPPMEEQLSNESRKFWDGVTRAILSQDFSQATVLKQQIEDRQRKKAAERAEGGKEWRPRFFSGALTPVGLPDLTEDGKRALDGLHMNDYRLEESEESGA